MSAPADQAEAWARLAAIVARVLARISNEQTDQATEEAKP